MSKSKPQSPVLTEKRRRISPGIVIVVVLILVLFAGVGFQYWRNNSGVDADASGTEPTLIEGPGTDGKGVTVGKQDAPNTMEIYLDFRCPHCKEFEDENSSVINDLVDSGVTKLTYWPMDFVSEDNSPRLANAWACAAAQGKSRGFADEIYQDFAKAWTTDQLLELGKKLGITDSAFEQCVKDNGQMKWVDSIQTAAEKRGVTGTPTVYVNGKQLSAEQQTPDGIRAALGVS